MLALVEEPLHRRPMMLAGASAVFTPRHILGAALAARASARINPRVGGVPQLGRKLEVAEIRVQPESPLAGYTLDETAIGARTGATVIGQWVGGELVVHDGSELRLEPDGILVAVGSHASIDRLHELAGGAVAMRREGSFVVGGGGEVGRKVAELLRAVGEEVQLINRHPGPEVDLVGEVLDARVLESAGVTQAQAVILALDTGDRQGQSGGKRGAHPPRRRRLRPLDQSGLRPDAGQEAAGPGIPCRRSAVEDPQGRPGRVRRPHALVAEQRKALGLGAEIKDPWVQLIEPILGKHAKQISSDHP